MRLTTIANDVAGCGVLLLETVVSGDLHPKPLLLVPGSFQRRQIEWGAV
jgi:hypothetical protein